MKSNFAKILTGIAIITTAFLLLLYFGYNLLSATKYTNIKDYEKCLTETLNKNNITHFPKVIPNNAEKIKFYCIPAKDEYSSGLYLLKFEIDDKYIDNEFKIHDFLNTYDKLGVPQKIYNMPSKYVGIKSEDLTYYVIKNKSNLSVKYKYFPYFSGIGINKDKNTILYYLINPD